MLRIKNLRKQFGSRTVLNVAALSLEKGKSYVLTGDNGVGKTTLLKILAGLETAQFEEFVFDGERVVAGRYPGTLRREIVYVHQHPYLFSTTVTDNIAYGLKFRHLPGTEIDGRVRDAIAWADLGALLDTPPQQLSGGEKQRVALARARVLRPKLLLLDEPTANLDRDSRGQVIDLIQRVTKGEASVLVACHDNEIIDLAHVQQLHLADGEVSTHFRATNLALPFSKGESAGGGWIKMEF